MPEIHTPYSISDLPQTSSPLSSRLSVQFGGTSKVYFGISHSSLTGYSLKTAARPLWTHPVSPVTSISAISNGTVKKDSNNSPIYYATVNTKGKASLHQFIPKHDTQGESEEKTLLSKCNQISSIQKSKNAEILYLVFTTGEVRSYSIEESTKKTTKKRKDEETGKIIEEIEESKVLEAVELWDIPAPSKGNICITSKFLKAPSKDLPEDGLVVTITKPTKTSKSFVVTVISLDTSEGRVLSSSTITAHGDEETGVFDISDDGLYRYVSSTATVHKYNILDPLETHSVIQLPARNPSTNQSTSTSILYLGNDQILISHGSSLLLVDLKYRVLLSEQSVPKPIFLNSYSKRLELAVGYTISNNDIANSTPNSATTGSEKIVAIPVEAGTGSLLESIGKGIVKSENTFQHAFTSIPVTFHDSEGSVNLVKSESTQVKSAVSEATAILQVLKHFMTTQNAKDFEKWALAYFKTSKKWIKTSTGSDVEEIIKATTVPEVSNSKKSIYKSKHDRPVDSTFVYELCNILFKNVRKIDISSLSFASDAATNTSPKKPFKSVKLHKNFAPEKLLGYLLTHPLLPSQQLPGLLLTLNRFPDLVRLAIKRAPSLRCETVVSALRSKDKDTFISSVIRLEHTFDSRQIISAIKLVYLSSEGKSSDEAKSKKSKRKDAADNSTSPFLDVAYSDNGTTLEDIVRHMISLDLGWSLIPFFIDAGGLFGWDEEFLAELDVSIKKSLEAYKGGYEVIAMLEEGMRASRRKGHNALAIGGDDEEIKVPVLVSAKQQSQQRMESMLPIGLAGKNTYGKKTASNNGARAASAIASYSVEKLLL